MRIALLVPGAAKGRDDVVAVLDAEDFRCLDGRKLSLGSDGSAQMWDDKLVTLVHRRVMGAKSRDGRIVDHVNGDRLDDHQANLGFVTAAESSASDKGRASSGFRGLHSMRSKWQARGKQGGRIYHLGTYDTLTKRPRSRTCRAWRTRRATPAGTSPPYFSPQRPGASLGRAMRVTMWMLTRLRQPRARRSPAPSGRSRCLVASLPALAHFQATWRRRVSRCPGPRRGVSRR